MLTIENLCAGYGAEDVLHGVNLRFDAGSCRCILGANGCGKTTLMRAIASLIEYRGRVCIDGRDLRTMRRAELSAHIAVMSQVTQLYFPYTVFETAMLGRYRHASGRIFRHETREDVAFVERCLAAVNLSAERDRRIDALSGGQRQRAFLAQTLAQDPEIILLDEPTNHLDVRHQLELIDYLRAWAGEGGHTVIGVFHDINLALRLSDDVIFMKDGRIGRQGRFSDIADGDYLHQIYGADIAGYMRSSLERWEEIR